MKEGLLSHKRDRILHEVPEKCILFNNRNKKADRKIFDTKTLAQG